jgi:hypothetical protein
VELEGLVPDRVLLRSVGEEEARDDLLVEGFVEVEGDLVRPSLDTGNTSIMVSQFEECTKAVSSAPPTQLPQGNSMCLSAPKTVRSECTLVPRNYWGRWL